MWETDGEYVRTFLSHVGSECEDFSNENRIVHDLEHLPLLEMQEQRGRESAVWSVIFHYFA
jgi:hypothetical protein